MFSVVAKLNPIQVAHSVYLSSLPAQARSAYDRHWFRAVGFKNEQARPRTPKLATSFDPPNVWSPFGAFSHSVIAGDGRTIYLNGQVALGRDGQIVGEGDMAVQVQQALQNISDILASMGGGMSDLVSLQQFTTDIQAFMKCGEVRMGFFQAPYPVTTTLEISSL